MWPCKSTVAQLATANEGVGVGRQAALFDDDDDCIERRVVLFDYVDNGVNVELDTQKRATVDDSIDEVLDVNNVVVAKGLVAAEGMSREDGVCFVDDADNSVNEDNVVSSLRPSQFSMLPVNLCQVQSGKIFSCHNFVTW